MGFHSPLIRRAIYWGGGTLGSHNQGVFDSPKLGDILVTFWMQIVGVFCQWLFLVPVKGGIGGIVHPPIGSIYHLPTTYMLPSGGLYATYHPLREPETTIDFGVKWISIRPEKG